MSECNALAYSLRQDEQGWRWSVYDEDGVTVADGAHPSQTAAQAAIERTFQSVGVSLTKQS